MPCCPPLRSFCTASEPTITQRTPPAYSIATRRPVSGERKRYPQTADLCLPLLSEDEPIFELARQLFSRLRRLSRGGQHSTWRYCCLPQLDSIDEETSVVPLK